jgi:hypothetical protein
LATGNFKNLIDCRFYVVPFESSGTGDPEHLAVVQLYPIAYSADFRLLVENEVACFVDHTDCNSNYWKCDILATASYWLKFPK